MVNCWIADLGNSGIKVCCFRGQTAGPVKRFYGVDKQKAAAWLKKRGVLKLYAAGNVPRQMRALARALKKKGITLLPIAKRPWPPLRFDYDFSQLGIDRLADVVAARRDYPTRNLIVLDFGTALTVNVIEGDVFKGGFIVPGCATLLSSLLAAAPALPRPVTKNAPLTLGRNTQSALREGSRLLFLRGVEGMLDWVGKDRGRRYRVIATGGERACSGGLPREVTLDEKLTLRGLYYLLEN